MEHESVHSVGSEMEPDLEDGEVIIIQSVLKNWRFSTFSFQIRYLIN